MSSSAVDMALTLPPAEVGPALLALTEDQWFDRKSIKIAPADLA
jgi:ATP-dependent DNA helicase RecG